ncbi:MAG: carboxypeptidase-like regulatory domain-containing protein, partial [Leadbetterella sp.]|nr:carboxypeptidase-like regulatory domain-containing protein [Leadbetterella sp.]
MKNPKLPKILLTVMALFAITSGLFANNRPISQSALVGIKGRVKSDESIFLKDVTISFAEAESPDIALDNTSTSPAGFYQSEKSFRKGQRILITARKTGFAELTKTIEITGSEDATVDFILDRRLFIAGFVRDSVSAQALPGADVFFFNKDGIVIKSVKTNQSGYYDFDAPFTPGEVIRLRIEKNPDYMPIEKTLAIIKHEIALPRLDFDMPKQEDRGIKLGFRVYNKKGKPLEGVEISYFDRMEKKLMLPVNGAVLLNIFQKQGTKMQFKFFKPGYR